MRMLVLSHFFTAARSSTNIDICDLSSGTTFEIEHAVAIVDSTPAIAL